VTYTNRYSWHLLRRSRDLVTSTHGLYGEVLMTYTDRYSYWEVLMTYCQVIMIRGTVHWQIPTNSVRKFRVS